MNFPTTGYVVSVTHLDTYIDVRTQVETENHRYCARLLVGHTNYQIRTGDLLLLERMTNPDMPVRDILLDCRLVIRDSCGAKTLHTISE